MYRIGKLSPQASFRTFLSPPEIPSSVFVVNPHSHPQTQAATDLCFVFIDLPFLNILYKWNHTICNLLHLASFI